MYCFAECCFAMSCFAECCFAMSCFAECCFAAIPVFGDAAAAAAADADAGRILETCQAPIHHAPGLRYIAEETPCSDIILLSGLVWSGLVWSGLVWSSLV